MRIREARKARTREALLDAAARVFARRGYHDARLEEIAEEAGFSTGAVYSSFAGKDELFRAMVDREIARETDGLVRAVAEAPTAEERLRRGAAQWMDFLRRDPDLFLLVMEFWARAVRTPDLAPRYVASRAQVTEAMAGLIEEGARELGRELVVPARQAAMLAESLADGLALRRLVAPDEVPDDLLPQVAALLVPALTRPLG